MTNLILFFNSFLSYLLLFAVIVVLGVAAALIGINLRKKKDAKARALFRKYELKLAATKNKPINKPIFKTKRRCL